MLINGKPLTENYYRSPNVIDVWELGGRVTSAINFESHPWQPRLSTIINRGLDAGGDRAPDAVSKGRA